MKDHGKPLSEDWGGIRMREGFQYLQKKHRKKRGSGKGLDRREAVGYMRHCTPLMIKLLYGGGKFQRLGIVIRNRSEASMSRQQFVSIARAISPSFAKAVH